MSSIDLLKDIPKDQIVSRECKHATYSINPDFTHDMLTVKEWVTLKSGERLPNLARYKDYKRPLWITKDGFRDHDEKIEFEELKRVDKIECRQLDVSTELYNRLRYGNPTWGIKQLARKPYVYGGDFGSEVYLKARYMERWPNVFQNNLVTVVDAETDVTKPGFNPILWSEVNDDEIVLYYNRKFTRGIPNYEDDVREAYHNTIAEFMDHIRNKLRSKDGSYPSWIDDLQSRPLRFVAGDDSLAITLDMVGNLHAKQPDIVTGWNVFFDVSVIHGALIDGGMDPKVVLSDPRVPPEFQMAHIKEGPRERRSAAGVTTKLDGFEQWHTTLHTASFRFVDSMQLYWQLRKAMGKEVGGYSLDAVMVRQLGVGKVTTGVSDSKVPTSTLAWHLDMQKNHKVAYGVYAIFDSVGLRCQEYKNNDLTSQISALAGSIDYSNYNSQPKINAVDMHFFALKHCDKVICTTSNDMDVAANSDILSRNGWIVTFPSHLVRDVGLYLFSDMPTIQSTITMFGADADVETTYPTAEIILNLGKEQTEAEACYIPEIGAEMQRRQSINVTGGRVNAIEIMQEVCGMKSLDTWADTIAAKYYPDEVVN